MKHLVVWQDFYQIFVYNQTMTSVQPGSEISPAARKKIIVLAPSGTLADFDEEYGLIHRETQRFFPDAEIVWTYASDSIRKRLPEEDQARLAPRAVFQRLQKMENVVGVVQSLHVIQGGEFARLINDASILPAGWSIGGPLLRDEADFEEMVDFIRDLRSQFADVDCVALVGHGAKAPYGLIYEKLAGRLSDEFGSSVLFGVLSNRPERAEVMRRIAAEGFKTVQLAPFLFSVGSHVRNDIMNGPHSWRRELEENGVSVSAVPYGLSRYPQIARMVLRRLRQALREGEAQNWR